ncbi:hypothetical protein HK101_001796 [Irineochytrium annulatum]|nr:hypothetical protein HK101_001796 [Irineochytrium annulatum]
MAGMSAAQQQQMLHQLRLQQMQAQHQQAGMQLANQAQQQQNGMMGSGNGGVGGAGAATETDRTAVRKVIVTTLRSLLPQQDEKSVNDSAVRIENQIFSSSATKEEYMRNSHQKLNQFRERMAQQNSNPQHQQMLMQQQQQQQAQAQAMQQAAAQQQQAQQQSPLQQQNQQQTPQLNPSQMSTNSPHPSSGALANNASPATTTAGNPANTSPVSTANTTAPQTQTPDVNAAGQNRAPVLTPQQKNLIYQSLAQQITPDKLEQLNSERDKKNLPRWSKEEYVNAAAARKIQAIMQQQAQQHAQQQALLQQQQGGSLQQQQQQQLQAAQQQAASAVAASQQPNGADGHLALHQKMQELQNQLQQTHQQQQQQQQQRHSPPAQSQSQQHGLQTSQMPQHQQGVNAVNGQHARPPVGNLGQQLPAGNGQQMPVSVLQTVAHRLFQQGHVAPLEASAMAAAINVPLEKLGNVANVRAINLLLGRLVQLKQQQQQLGQQQLLRAAGGGAAGQQHTIDLTGAGPTGVSPMMQSGQVMGGNGGGLVGMTPQQQQILMMQQQQQTILMMQQQQVQQQQQAQQAQQQMAAAAAQQQQHFAQQQQQQQQQVLAQQQRPASVEDDRKAVVNLILNLARYIPNLDKADQFFGQFPQEADKIQKLRSVRTAITNQIAALRQQPPAFNTNTALLQQLARLMIEILKYADELGKRIGANLGNFTQAMGAAMTPQQLFQQPAQPMQQVMPGGIQMQQAQPMQQQAQSLVAHQLQHHNPNNGMAGSPPMPQPINTNISAASPAVQAGLLANSATSAGTPGANVGSPTEGEETSPVTNSPTKESADSKRTVGRPKKGSITSVKDGKIEKKGKKLTKKELAAAATAAAGGSSSGTPNAEDPGTPAGGDDHQGDLQSQLMAQQHQAEQSAQHALNLQMHAQQGFMMHQQQQQQLFAATQPLQQQALFSQDLYANPVAPAVVEEIVEVRENDEETFDFFKRLINETSLEDDERAKKAATERQGNGISYGVVDGPGENGSAGDSGRSAYGGGLDEDLNMDLDKFFELDGELDGVIGEKVEPAEGCEADGVVVSAPMGSPPVSPAENGGSETERKEVSDGNADAAVEGGGAGSFREEIEKAQELYSVSAEVLELDSGAFKDRGRCVVTFIGAEGFRCMVEVASVEEYEGRKRTTSGASDTGAASARQTTTALPSPPGSGAGSVGSSPGAGCIEINVVEEGEFKGCGERAGRWMEKERSAGGGKVLDCLEFVLGGKR